MTSLLDIIGPIMIGPSSSHTAGAARIAKLAGRLGGLLGFEPDDARLRDAKAFASAAYTYSLSVAEGAEHPNTARLLLRGSRQTVEVGEYR